MTYNSTYDPIIRPNPLHYVAFVYGAALPDRNRAWVRRALINRTASDHRNASPHAGQVV